MPATTPLSNKISKDLKKMGFKFVGSTTIYSFMQAIGMVNDHITGCFVYEEILKEYPHDAKADDILVNEDAKKGYDGKHV